MGTPSQDDITSIDTSPAEVTGKAAHRSRPVAIGGIWIGGGHPVAVQSMTNTATQDTEACVEQIVRIRDAGCRIVRLTTQGHKEAENLSSIRQGLLRRDICDVALVADVHFTPEVAMTAAMHADKVRINPGNFNDPDGKQFRILVERCRERNIPLRIGVNHGSLSPRIVESYGDTPEGMAESAMEFLRRSRGMDFDKVVVSMKSSNVRVMVHAYRILANAMRKEGFCFPLHLGVTEAGDGPEGRIKSAVGIGTLLCEGLGDTIRVSLTEPPQNEIPVGTKITAYAASERVTSGAKASQLTTENAVAVGSISFSRRESLTAGNIGGGQPVLLYHEIDDEAMKSLADNKIVLLSAPEADTSQIGITQHNKTGVGVVNAPVAPAAPLWRKAIATMDGAEDRRPVIVHRKYTGGDLENFHIMAAIDFGPLLLDGLVDALWIEGGNSTTGDKIFTGGEEDNQITDTALTIMQAARVRFSKTEFIACPGCGRTLFDLQGTLARVREKTSHLKGLKIAVMGCIVNGPGEMADADYGYVGSGRGRVTLYRGKEVCHRAIAEEDAVDALVELIKEWGDWKEKES